jgi:hypothetical protein
MNPLFSNLLGPVDDDAAAGAGTEETFELLNAEEEPEVLELPTKKIGEESESVDTDEEGEEETEEDELKEIEEELKPPSEEDLLELTTPVRRKEILAKYPKLFKDFPYLEKAYYREQQFTEVFPTIQDARLSAEKAEILDKTEQLVMSGDISSVIIAAREEDPEAFNKIVDNYLPTLRKVDQQAYYHVLSGVIKDTIITMVREGRALGDQGAPLQAAANVLNQFVFGSQTFQPHQPLSQKVNPNEQAREYNLQQQQQQIVMTKFNGVREDLQTKADNVLKSTIDGHIDPRGTMSDYVKQHAKAEAFNNLEDLISKDVRFRSLLDKLWQQAFQKDFDKESTDRIKSAYLSKAKTLLPSVIKKARSEAMRGRKADNDDILGTKTDKKGPITPGRSTAPSSGKFKKASDIPKGMSTLDVLMKD